MDEHKARRRGRAATRAANSRRQPNYRQLRHPFPPQAVLPDEAVSRIHDMALKVLADLGLKILLPAARDLFRAAGAAVDDASQMVRIGPEIVDEALRAAPRSFRLRASNSAREQDYAEGAMLFAAGAGCPNATDLVRGRRPGSLRDYEETLKLQQSFDVIHIHGPSAEPQDIPAELRHYDMMRGQMVLGDKPMFVYARGRGQVAESLEMIALGLGLGDAELAADVWCYTVINTNSPRQIDVPMAEGLIDFARAGQLSIVTPFCLAGAMAPVTVTGALVLQHAEALGAIALTQLAKPGAPVSYGGFGSNVDMKSGAPAFGTPEHMKMSIGSGQLARHIGLPWRSAAGSASNIADMQAAGENHMSLWAATLANATLTIHAAGWLEGGLTFGYEKFINDVEALQTIAELSVVPEADEASLGWDALADVEPGGHFFATQHTMDRYATAFYDPLVADLSNFGTWSDSGGQTSTVRATAIWQKLLADYTPPEGSEDRAARLTDFIANGKAKGGIRPSE
ncbi:MAG: trimethylamine methyltransferase family protein [Paracoccaceae bacterium]